MSLWKSIKKMFHKNTQQTELTDDLQWTTVPPEVGNQAAINMLNLENQGYDVDDMHSEIVERMEDSEDEAAPDEEEEVQSLSDEKKHSADAVERLEGHNDTLKETKKWGVGWNSNSYKLVMNKVEKTMNGIASGEVLNDDMYGSTRTIIRTMKDYKEIIDACDAYLASHKNPRTSEGKARKEAVLRVKEQAAKDIQGLRDYLDTMSSLRENERAGSVRDVLTKSRRRIIQLKKGEDGSEVREENLEHVGEQASRLAVVNSDATTDGASGFFKKEDNIDMQSDEAYDKHRVNLDYLGISRSENGVEKNEALYSTGGAEFALKKSGGNNDKREKLIGIVKDNKKSYKNIKELFQAKVKNTKDYKNDAEFRNMADKYYDLLIKQNGFLEDKGGAVENLNLSARNVATSRVAQMLGISDLIAQSETAVLRDSDGWENVGNMMQRADGSELEQKLGELSREDYNNQLVTVVNREREIAQRENLTGWGNVGDPVTENDIRVGYYKRMRQNKLSEDAVTPEYMRSMISLQVLDTLVGQTDRHFGNIFVNSTGEGKNIKLGKVTGIDNDYSFGNTSLYGTDDDGYIGAHGRSFAVDGEFSLPYMDDDLATRIQNLYKSDVELMLSDVLEDWAIDSFWKRIEQAKKVIGDARARDNSRFIKPDEWDMDKYHEFVNAPVGRRANTRNYLQKVHNFDHAAAAEQLILKELEKKNKTN